VLNVDASNVQDEWDMFEQGFDWFITATDFNNNRQVIRIAMVLSSVGEDAESLIRDRIIFGCPGARVKERLVSEDNLALKSAFGYIPCR